MKQILLRGCAGIAVALWCDSASAEAKRDACTFNLQQAIEAQYSPKDQLEWYDRFIKNCPSDPRLGSARRERNRIWKLLHPPSPPAPPPPPTKVVPSPPRPPVPPPPLALPAVPAAQPSAPTPRDGAIVDANGGGDFRTIGEALASVRDGATIFIHEGHYRENLTITKSVKLVGESNFRTVITGSIQSNADNLTLQGLSLEGRAAAGTLRIKGGSAYLQNCLVQNDGGVARDGIRTAAVVILDGLLEIVQGVTGPGTDAAILISGGQLVARHADIKGYDGLGIFATGNAEIDIAKVSKISGEIAIFTTGRVNLRLTRSTLSGTRDDPVVQLNGQTQAEIRNNKVTIDLGNGRAESAGRHWISAAPTVDYCMEGNWTGKDKFLAEVTCRSRRLKNLR